MLIVRTFCGIYGRLKGWWWVKNKIEDWMLRLNSEEIRFFCEFLAEHEDPEEAEYIQAYHERYVLELQGIRTDH